MTAYPMLYSVSGLLPHKPPMLFIDTVKIDGPDVEALCTVKADWLLLDTQGLVSGAAFFELMAQGYAAIRAVSSLQDNAAVRGEESAPGFLVGVKNFQAASSAQPGDNLAICTANHVHIGPFNIFDAFVYTVGRKLLASGQIKVFLPAEEDNSPQALRDQL